jgi:hypothetical protein
MFHQSQRFNSELYIDRHMHNKHADHLLVRCDLKSEIETAISVEKLKLVLFMLFNARIMEQHLVLGTYAIFLAATLLPRVVRTVRIIIERAAVSVP